MTTSSGNETDETEEAQVDVIDTTIHEVDLRETSGATDQLADYLAATGRAEEAIEPEELPFYRSWRSLGGVAREAAVFHRLYEARRVRDDAHHEPL